MELSIAITYDAENMAYLEGTHNGYEGEGRMREKIRKDGKKEPAGKN